MIREGERHEEAVVAGRVRGHAACKRRDGAGAIRIGAINPYSGPVALYGDEVARGYQLQSMRRTPRAA